MNELTVKSESYFKILLAIYIVISHQPHSSILGTYNYLPVAAFFFLSGYGLEKCCENKKKFDVIKSGKKLLLPFYITQLIYFLLFIIQNTKQNATITLIKELFLINVDLPYAWYVRTQLILYIIWFFVCKIEKKTYRLMATFAGLIIYAISASCLGWIFTSYKTIIAFGFGVVYCQFEDQLKRFMKLHWVIIAFISSGLLRLLVRGETFVDFILYSLSACFICVCSVYVIYNFKLEKLVTSKISNLSYELYLVQGIAQCIFMNMYFCNHSILNMKNTYIGALLAIVTTFILAFGLKVIVKFFNSVSNNIVHN